MTSVSTRREDGSVTLARVYTSPKSSEDVLAIGYANENPARQIDVLGRRAGHVVDSKDRKPIVTNWTGPKDFFHAPPSYEAFYSQYRMYIRRLVSQFANSSDDIDEITDEIITRFIERDSIGVFSNEWGSQSETGLSNFRSYLSRFVVTYARGKNRNAVRWRGHHPLIFDAPVSTEDESDTVTFGETVSPSITPVEEQATFNGIVDCLYSRVDPEMRQIVGVIVDEAMNASTVVKVAALARRLGCPQRVARQHLDSVREILSEVVRAE